MNANKGKTAIKIKEITLNNKNVENQAVVTLPKVWTKDQGIKQGDTLEIFRDQSDNLIIRKAAV